MRRERKASIGVALCWLSLAGCAGLEIDPAGSTASEPSAIAPATDSAPVAETTVVTPALPRASEPPAEATPPSSTASTAAPAAPTTRPAPLTQPPERTASAAPPPPPAPIPATPPAASAAEAPLDFSGLETRLRQTKAIGVLTKLSVKNQAADLLERFRAYHKQPNGSQTLTELRRAYDMLLLKLLSLLQDGDPPLAKDIDSSRAAIWEVLADPRKFIASNLMAGA